MWKYDYVPFQITCKAMLLNIAWPELRPADWYPTCKKEKEKERTCVQEKERETERGRERARACTRAREGEKTRETEQGRERVQRKKEGAREKE